MSKHLVTIRTDAPVPFVLDELRRQEPDVEACRALFVELGFNTLTRSVLPPPSAPGQAAVAAPTAGVGVSVPALGTPLIEDASAETLAALLATDGPLALYVTATSPDLLGGSVVGLAANGGQGWRVASQHFPTLAAALPGREWITHDAKALRRALVQLGLPAPTRLHDTQIYSYLLDPTNSDHTLPAVAARYLGLNPSGDPGEGAAMLAHLAAAFRPAVAIAGQERAYLELDLPLVPVLERMEDAGIYLDPQALATLSADLEARSRAEASAVYELAGQEVNINSPKQLGEVLFGKLNLPAPPRRGKTKSLSTAVDVLEELAEAFPIARHVLDYRQLSKLKSTYADALPQLIDAKTGRLHTTFQQTATATGRLSSINPNLQNIPIRSELGREIRAAFAAPPGTLLLVADYSQIELRLLAHFSQDPLLLAAFRANEDIHRLTAAEVFGVPPLLISAEHRRRAKAVNFGIVYGLSAFGLAKQLGIPQSEAADFIRRYFERYAGVRRYIDQAIETVRRTGEVRTLHGRRRPIPEISSKNPTLRGFAERTAINSPLQGTAADLIKLAMIRIDHRLQQGEVAGRMLLQVHDELVFEAPTAAIPALAKLVKHEMENAAALSVPLTVELGAGRNWRDVEAVEK